MTYWPLLLDWSHLSKRKAYVKLLTLLQTVWILLRLSLIRRLVRPVCSKESPMAVAGPVYLKKLWKFPCHYQQQNKHRIWELILTRFIDVNFLIFCKLKYWLYLLLRYFWNNKILENTFKFDFFLKNLEKIVKFWKYIRKNVNSESIFKKL